jgi:DNA-directed RNA polymerase
MRNVINSMADDGIDSFWSVHDSFGTHAADIGKMRKIINEEFVKLHKGRNINWWCEQMYPEWDSSDDEWVWEKFDLDDVLESEFLVG